MGTQNINELIDKIRNLENQLEAEFMEARGELQGRIENGRIIFEENILRQQKELKTRLLKYILDTRLLIILTAPFIYVLIVPLLLLDVFLSLYQAICFSAYGIPKVRRKDFIIFDRARLAYLNGIEKLNCAYCSYGNGLLAYAREIASRTEQYWCPIKHALRVKGAHRRYRNFVDYGNAKAYREQLENLRNELKNAENEAAQK